MRWAKVAAVLVAVYAMVVADVGLTANDIYFVPAITGTAAGVYLTLRVPENRMELLMTVMSTALLTLGLSNVAIPWSLDQGRPIGSRGSTTSRYSSPPPHLPPPRSSTGCFARAKGFNRSTYHAEMVVEEFTGSLVNRVDPEMVLEDWVAAVNDAMQPSKSTVWVNELALTMENSMRLVDSTSSRRKRSDSSRPVTLPYRSCGIYG